MDNKLWGGGGEVESAGFQVRDDSTLDLGSGDEGAENLPDPRLNIRVIQFLKMQLRRPFPLCLCYVYPIPHRRFSDLPGVEGTRDYFCLVMLYTLQCTELTEEILL